VGVVPVVMPASTSHATSVKLWGPVGVGLSALRQRKTAISARVTLLLGEKVVGVVPVVMPASTSHAMAVLAK